jgi:hypothetical protein
MSGQSVGFVLPRIITLDNGREFTCTPVEVGGRVRPRQQRWRFVDMHGIEYVGPAYRAETSPADLQRLVAEWWEAKKALGQEGVSAETLRTWLVDGR